MTNIELTDTAVAKFNDFFNQNAKDGVSLQATILEALSTIEDRIGAGESLVYELGRQYTKSGKPETIRFDAKDVKIDAEDMLMNPHTGSVQSRSDWLADGFDQENAELIEVIQDTNGDWVEK